MPMRNKSGDEKGRFFGEGKGERVNVKKGRFIRDQGIENSK